MADPAAKFTILIVDDSEDILALLELTLRKEYQVKRAADGRAALRVAFEKPRPDLILLDVEMPGTNGYDVCRAIKASPALADVPVIFLTQRNEAQDVVQGFQLGAIDYFAKPINPPVLAARIHAHVELITRRSQQDELIRVRTTQLEQTRLQLIRRLGRAMEYHETSAVGNRVVRLGHYARQLAEAAGAKPVLCDLIMKAAPLHDIGKLGVPAQILRKTEKLSAPEREQMQRHPEIGAEIIGEHDDPLLKLARTLALTHHERWDGTGYPSGLNGNAIPWPGRVMAIVDAFEGMTATQFHREPMPIDLAIEEVVRGSGKQFDPQMVEAFRKALPGMRTVKDTYADALGDMLDLDFSSPQPPQKSAVQEAPAAAVSASAAAERETMEAMAVQSMRETDEARARTLASAQARLKVERDLTAAAVKDVSTQQAARKRAEEAGARDAELIELSKKRTAEEATAARAAQERAKAEANAAVLAQKAAQAKAQELAEVEARIKSEQSMAVASEQKRNAEEALAKTGAELAAAKARADAGRLKADAEAQRAATEEAARKRATELAALETRAAQSARERAASETAAQRAAEERLKAEQAAAKAAEEAAGAERQRAAAAKQRVADAAAAKAAAERRLQAEADAAKAAKDAQAATAEAVVVEKAVAELQVRLKVERDLTAAAAKELAGHRSARDLARELAARENEALEAAKRRLAEEAAVARMAQERAKAEENAAKLAQQATQAKAQVLAEAERGMAAAAAARTDAAEATRRKAQELTALETSAAEQVKARLQSEARAAEAEKRRATEEQSARRAAQDRADAEAKLAGAARELEQAKANALTQAQERMKSEQALAAAVQEKLRAEDSARRMADEAIAANSKAIGLAKQRADTQTRVAEAARGRKAAEAEATKLAGERVEIDTAQSARTREWAGSGNKPEAAPPRRHTTPLTPVYAAILVAVAVAAVAFYGELQTPPASPRTQAAQPPTPITAPASRPIAGLSDGAPLELRLDVDFEKLAPKERAN